MLSKLKFKFKSLWKKVTCKHDYKYTGIKNDYYTETCKKCNSVSIQKVYKG